ncbi:MAG: hypothetical protein ACPG4Z_03760 [Chitinophagales bacterium]
MKRHFFYTIFFILIVGTSFAQRKKNLYTATGENAIYKNEWSIGARLHTNGFSAFYERVWVKNIWKKSVLQTDFFYYKDYRESKTDVSPALSTSNRTYIYGKQNNFFQFKLGYGQRKIIANKMDQKGVRFSWFYMGGVSLGLLKPYHLEIKKDNESSFYAYGEIPDDVFLSIDSNNAVLGAGGVQYGFNKLKPLPSIYGKFGFNFDWANKEYFVKALEVGVQLDVFYKKLPIMITSRNKPYILNFYMSIQMGKRW